MPKTFFTLELTGESLEIYKAIRAEKEAQGVNYEALQAAIAHSFSDRADDRRHRGSTITLSTKQWHGALRPGCYR